MPVANYTAAEMAGSVTEQSPRLHADPQSAAPIYSDQRARRLLDGDDAMAQLGLWNGGRAPEADQ